MEIRYNVTGAQRKELVKAIADTTGAKAKYMGMPTAAYEIDYFTVTKDGMLIFDDRADSEEVEQVLEAIAAAGFDCEPQTGLRWRFRGTAFRTPPLRTCRGSWIPRRRS